VLERAARALTINLVACDILKPSHFIGEAPLSVTSVLRQFKSGLRPAGTTSSFPIRLNGPLHHIAIRIRQQNAPLVSLFQDLDADGLRDMSIHRIDGSGPANNLLCGFALTSYQKLARFPT
jgi:hypothetical protein